MNIRAHLLTGQVIPAHPLALDGRRRLDELRQRALTRYYIDSGAGGIAVGVHTTQFGIRERGLLAPVLELASQSADDWLAPSGRDFLRIAGLCGRSPQACGEAETARSLGYHAGLLSLGAWGDASLEEILSHCAAVAEIIPLIGFYLQPAVGGRIIPFRFWRRFAEIPNVVAIKIAPFNRYQTLDVVRAVAESGRDDIALYTGNDDNIFADLTTPFPSGARIVGGLLGQWAVWTSAAVAVYPEIRALARGDITDLAERRGPALPPEYGAQLTDANGAIFDAANQFRGCIPGIHEVLRRQGLLAGIWCLDPKETLSPGQPEEIDRVIRAYPHLTDDAFVLANLDRWLS